MSRDDLEAQRVMFEAWWEDFTATYPDWPFADGDHIRLTVWKAAIAAQAPICETMADCAKCKAIGAAYKIGKQYGQELAAPVQGEPVACRWTPDADNWENGVWHSSCGDAWSFIEGGPQENHVKFCQGCGKPVAIDAARKAGT